jgi:hypothetical protein
MYISMEFRQLLQQLREADLEEGRRLIAERASVLDNQAALGILLAGEALDQVFANPATSLKLAELLIFLGEHFQQPSSQALGLKAKGDVLKTIGLHQAAAEAIILFNKGGLDYYTAITKLQQAELLLEMGHTDEAYEQAELLKKYFDEQNLVSRSVRASPQ